MENLSTGERIRNIRKQKNMTQEQLGNKCGIAGANIRKYELSKQNPKIETLQKIADALEVSIAELVPGFFDEKRSMNNQVIHNLELLLKQLPDMKLPDEIKELHRQNATNEIKKRKEELIRMDLELMPDSNLKKLFKYFFTLNEIGQKKALEQVELLSKIPDYKDS